MKKIIIFGNSGAGKSTLAKKLKQEFNLAHLDLDTLAWSDTIPPQRKPLTESNKEIDTFLLSAPGWIIEGCYADLLSYVIENANEVIFLKPDIEVCIQRCRLRPWEPHKYKSIEEQDKNLPMLIDWVKQYESRSDEFSLRAHQVLFDSFTGKKTIVS